MNTPGRRVVSIDPCLDSFPQADQQTAPNHLVTVSTVSEHVGSVVLAPLAETSPSSHPPESDQSSVITQQPTQVEQFESRVTLDVGHNVHRETQKLMEKIPNLGAVSLEGLQELCKEVENLRAKLFTCAFIFDPLYSDLAKVEHAIGIAKFQLTGQVATGLSRA